MAPKTIFDKETIIEAAFEIAKESGMSSITTRNVAKRLGSSVAPIYVNFQTVEELNEAVIKRIMNISSEIMDNQTGAGAFYRIGKASLAFARDYPVLFRELTMQPNEYMASYDTMEKSLLETMAEDVTMGDWTLNDRRELLLKMRAFQIGLSVMISNGQMPSWLNDKETDDLLMSTGEDLLTATNFKRNK